MVCIFKFALNKLRASHKTCMLMEMMNNCSIVISFKCLVFSPKFS
jgi:hypothetical protein